MKTIPQLLRFPLLLLAALLISSGYGCDNDPVTPATGLDTTDVTADIGGPDADASTDTSADSDAAPDVDAVADTATDAGADADAVADAATDAVAEIDAAIDIGLDGASPELFSCKSDLDCVAMETECCDHCNGGKALSVAKAYLTEAKALFGPSKCEGIACTEMACAPSKVLCNNNKCALSGCTNTPASKLCIRGKQVADGEEIAAGDPIQVQVYPKGCFSSSCTKKEVASCSLEPGNVTTFVKAEFCLANTSGSGGCTADCSGGGFATCGSGTWSAGEWPYNLNGTIVTVKVPSKLPFGGQCAGSQF